MEATWKPGFRAKIDAPIALSELERLREIHGRIATPSEIVAEAELDDSPLHPQFEWNDDFAAGEFRKEQARSMVRSICVIEEVEKGDNQVRPYYVHVKLEAEGESGYMPLTVALSDDVLRKQVLARALKELTWFRKKYGNLQELKRVFEAHDELEKDFAASETERSGEALVASDSSGLDRQVS